MFHAVYVTYVSRHVVVPTFTGLGAEQTWDQIPGGTRNSFLFQKAQSGSGLHSTPYSMEAGVFPEGNATGRGVGGWIWPLIYV
jgi:hypothetical protein